MNYKEDIIFEKAFLDFLLKHRKKKEIKIKYYELGRKYDCAFFGYSTKGGIHGLHFNRTSVRYYFGERNPTFGVKPFPLLPPMIIKMPAIFRDALLYSTNNRTNVLIKDNKIIDLNTGDLVSG